MRKVLAISHIVFEIRKKKPFYGLKNKKKATTKSIRFKNQ